METSKYGINNIDKIINDLYEEEVVGFPTETVYGLAIVYDSINAFNKLAMIKQRPITKPLSMMVSDVNEIYKYAYVNEPAKKIINKFMPGSLTIVLKAKENLPSHNTMNLNTIGIRIPSNKTALEILKKCEKPLLVTSANISSFAPLQTATDVFNTFNGKIKSLIMEDSLNDTASTVIDMSSDNIKILREGIIKKEDIIKCLEENYENCCNSK